MSFLGKEQAVMNMATFMSNPSIQEEKEVTGAGAGAGAAHGQSLGALHMLLVMSTVYQPAFRRELLVASFDSAEVDALASFFESKGADVQLSPMTVLGGTSAGDHSVTFEDGRILCIRVFNQGNVKASRKQIAPLVQDFYDSK